MSEPQRHFVPPHDWWLVSSTDVPAGSAWLGPREREVERGLTIARRRRDWRAGRWAAKSLGPTNGQPSEWEIIASEDGSPQVWFRGHKVGSPLSISHRGEFAAAALSADDREIGIDLELCEPHTMRFVRDFFAPPEVDRAERLGSSLRDRYASLVWSAKEAVLKCLRQGLNRDTRSVLIDVDPAAPRAREGGWSPFVAMDRQTGSTYDGWWTSRGHLLVTLASTQRR